MALVHPELDPSGAMLQATCDKLESDLAFATSEHSRKVSELETRIHWLQTKVVALSIERDLIWEHANVDVQDAPLDWSDLTIRCTITTTFLFFVCKHVFNFRFLKNRVAEIVGGEKRNNKIINFLKYCLFLDADDADDGRDDDGLYDDRRRRRERV